MSDRVRRTLKRLQLEEVQPQLYIRLLIGNNR